MLWLDDIIGDGRYKNIAEQIVTSLSNDYLSPDDSEAILEHATYAVTELVGNDKPCIWGDYYFTEAVSRLYDSGNFIRFW